MMKKNSAHLGKAVQQLEQQSGNRLLVAGVKLPRAAGTPFLSFFAPDEMLALAREAGFRDARHVSTADLTQRYFSGRTDRLRPSTGDSLFVVST
jgi:O-methyltransferase involved in polyketide biosynthesis